jgi:hypothetical protein
MQKQWTTKWNAIGLVLLVALVAMISPRGIAAQDNDDPPGRAARLGRMDGSISFQPAGESEWVEAVPNRPMTTGDKLWADKDSRAEVELGPVSIRLSSNTGMSFLNLDDRMVQLQVSSGTISVRVRRFDQDGVLEIDTPNQAFSVNQEGSYRVEASEDGTYTVVTVRHGEGESTGNGQTYTVHEGQRATFSGTNQLNADVEQVGEPDAFDQWSDGRDRRFDESPSSRYVSRDVVGAQDLDAYGDWQPAGEYGNVWYPRVAAGWAPYHDGHWAWVDPWGWTWVDDAPWGYAPAHYGRWAFVGNRWGWVPGPLEARPVYAPALVVFVGGGGPAMGGNVAWFPLGPREVYVPSYHVSPAYVNRVNISNTNVSQTTVTNVYNTTVVNNTTVINNVTYANRNVSGAVTAVPQQAFSSAQPVARNSVTVSRQQIAAAQVNSRAAVAPSNAAVMGVHAATANHVAAPPQDVQQRQVIAKATPPPPPVAFAAKQQVLAAHPGQPVARQEMQRLQPAAAAARPMVRVAPPGKPATATVGHPAGQPAQPAANQPVNRPASPPATQPGNQPASRSLQPAETARPGAPPAPAPAPASRPAQPAPENNRPPATQPNRPAQPAPSPENNRPPAAQPNRPDNNRPENNPPAQTNRPQPNQPQTNQPTQPPARNNRPQTAQPPANRPAPPPAQNNRPAEAPQQRPQTAPPADRPPQRTPPPAETRPPQQQHPQPAPKPLTPEEKKRQDEQRKNEKPQ